MLDGSADTWVRKGGLWERLVDTELHRAFDLDWLVKDEEGSKAVLTNGADRDSLDVWRPGEGLGTNDPTILSDDKLDCGLSLLARCGFHLAAFFDH
jgi:hypothetical protein